MEVLKGSTNVTTYFVMRLAADGTEATGLTIANMDLQYVRSGVAPAAKVDAQALAATDTAHTDNFAIEIDATDQPGLYRVDWPDAAFATGVRQVILSVKCATAFTEHKEVDLVDFNPQDGVRLGLTALPNAAADAAGGLPISDAGGLDLDAKIGALTYSTANRVDAQVLGIANDAITANAIAANAITSTEIADGAITAAKFGAGAIDATAIANGAIDAATFAAGAIDATAIAANAIGASELAADAVDEILDEVIEGTLTLRQAIRVIVSACAGKLSGAATTTVVIRDTTDNKDRVTATVDADGNRSAVTLDVS